jgi:hypothetical protein
MSQDDNSAFASLLAGPYLLPDSLSFGHRRHRVRFALVV